MTEPGSAFHARTLRAIGQDLADLLPENLAIEPSGEDFIAHGMCSRARLKSAESDQGLTGLRKFSAKLRAGIIKQSSREPDLDLAPFSRTYHPVDIDSLDEAGKQRRIGSTVSRNDYAPSVSLSTAKTAASSESSKIYTTSSWSTETAPATREKSNWTTLNSIACNDPTPANVVMVLASKLAMRVTFFINRNDRSKQLNGTAQETEFNQSSRFGGNRAAV
ncbi:MAG: hypothetical protein HW373_811 [Deltaproteobacteria bacterium]|nr:hypothetical protein [Deltaproteobacteria bacterium]